MHQTPDVLMEIRVQNATFNKSLACHKSLTHHARIITYVDLKKILIQLLTNDLESDPSEIVEIYRKSCEIELLFKQIKQNFPLRYFYGESANAIKIQIWVTLIANLLLLLLQKIPMIIFLLRKGNVKAKEYRRKIIRPHWKQNPFVATRWQDCAMLESMFGLAFLQTVARLVSFGDSPRETFFLSGHQV